MISEENFKALTENQSIDFDTILESRCSGNAAARRQIAGCLYLMSCMQTTLLQRDELSQQVDSDELTDLQKQDCMTALSGIIDTMENVTISFGKASITVDVNSLDVYDHLATFIKFVANTASGYDF